MAITTAKKKSTIKKAVRSRRRATSKARKSGVDIAASYNQFKVFNGKQYTGMQVGRSHKWYYDKGEWKETKITPDLWEIFYAVTKRRAGKAPAGSGAAVGTGYHWYIIAHQDVRKLNANDYTTVLSGLKFKLAHMRAGKNSWSATAATQRKYLIKFLREMITQLEKKPIPIEIEYNGKVYKGEGIPIPQSCHDGVCSEIDITLNGEHTGIIRRLKSGWKMHGVDDQKFIDAIGDEILLWYE